MPFKLNDKVIVLTGATGEIGTTLSTMLLKSNAKVIMQYKSIMPKTRNIETKNFIYIQADITKYEDVKNLCSKAINKYGKVDVLINNAGVEADSPIDCLNIYDWNTVINTNLTGTFYCCKEFSKIMKQQRNGKIINIASLKGIKGSKFQTNYSASKGGIIALTKSLAMELGDYNITVNSVCPGFIQSKLNNYSEQKQKSADYSSAIKGKDMRVILKHFIAFMCTDEFESVSGQNFILDSRIY